MVRPAGGHTNDKLNSSVCPARPPEMASLRKFYRFLALPLTHALPRHRSGPRSDLFGCFPGSQPLGGDQPARRGPGARGWQRLHDPDRVGEHELGHGPTPGRDARSARRTRRPSAGPAAAGPRRRHPLGEGAAGRVGHPGRSGAGTDRRRSPETAATGRGSRRGAAFCGGRGARRDPGDPSRHGASGCATWRPGARCDDGAGRRRSRWTACGVRRDGRRRPRVRPGAEARSRRRNTESPQRAAQQPVSARPRCRGPIAGCRRGGHQRRRGGEGDGARR